MNDMELLELAAKATGLDDSDWTAGWDPISDDGDALRLAVKLRLHVDHSRYGGVTAWHVFDSGVTPFEEEGIDEYENTRRAIVRAAAEIGKEMK